MRFVVCLLCHLRKCVTFTCSGLWKSGKGRVNKVQYINKYCFILPFSFYRIHPVEWILYQYEYYVTVLHSSLCCLGLCFSISLLHTPLLLGVTHLQGPWPTHLKAAGLPVIHCPGLPCLLLKVMAEWYSPLDCCTYLC